jgi:hypothetical protein
MALFGICVVFYSTVNQTSLQLNTPSDKLGSVMTLSSYGQQGMTPIGSLITGWLIRLATARLAIGVGGLTALVAAAVLGIGVMRAGRHHTGFKGLNTSEDDLPGAAGAIAS